MIAARAALRSAAPALAGAARAPRALPVSLLAGAAALWALQDAHGPARCDLRSSALKFGARFHNENIPAKELQRLQQETSLSNMEIIQLHEAFKVLDTDQLRTPGRISENEFGALAAQLGLGAPEVVHRLFQLFDRDHSGTVDFREFVGAISLMSHGSPFEKLKFFFSSCDVDGSGGVDRAELRLLLRTLFSLGVKTTGQDSAEVRSDAEAEAAAMTERVFAAADVNHDGQLSFAEFYKWASEGHADARLIFAMFDVFSHKFEDAAIAAGGTV